MCTTCNHQDDLRRPSKEVKMQLPDDDEWNLDDDDDDDDNDDDFIQQGDVQGLSGEVDLWSSKRQASGILTYSPLRLADCLQKERVSIFIDIIIVP